MDHLTTAADSNTSLENALDDGNILESNKQHPNVENIDSNVSLTNILNCTLLKKLYFLL